MEPAVKPLTELVALNTDLLMNCLQDVTEADAETRPLARANSLALLVVHVVDVIDDGVALPGLRELAALWSVISSHVLHCLDTALPALLASRAPQRFPVDDQSVLAGLAFLVQHES